MANDLLGVSVTGLRVSQTALRTAGHNIANADTPGFSRQRTDIVSNQGTFTGVGYIGNGASVTSIERIANQFVTQQVRLDTTLFNQLNAFSENIRQLDTLVSDPATGLSQGLETFFSAMQNGADDPTSIPARQLIVSEAENISSRFSTLYDRIESISNGVNEKLSVAVSKINALAVAIADLNSRISKAIGVGGDNPPNDLLDHRDEALRQLSELVNMETFGQGQGQVNVLIGTGQPLVVGVASRSVALVDGVENPSNRDIAYQGELGSQVITSLLDGGEIGGLVDFREQVLGTAFNELGRVAVVLSDTFNRLHQQGIDLNNQFGNLFFSDINGLNTSMARVAGNKNNLQPANQVVSVEIIDTSVLTASNYEFSIEATSNLYRIKRLSDNVEVRSDILPGSLPTSIEFDGLRLNLLSGMFQNGDKFLIRPTRFGGRDIESALINPQDIAFGSPVLTDASIGNVGSGEINAGEVLGLEDANGNALSLFASPGKMSPPIIVKFTTPTTYDVLDNSDPGNPVDLNPPLRNQQYIPGIVNNLFTEDPGETVVVANGIVLGLPNGRAAITQASLQLAAPPAVAPAFAVTDFSASTNQFSFDVVVGNTLSGVNNGTFTVTVNEPAIVDNAALLTAVNNDLIGTDVRAYIADNGTLAFRLLTPGVGDITVQNYNADPDGGADLAPAGQANALLGFNVEGATFTTVANANGISGIGVLSNNYPTEVVTINTTDPSTGVVTAQNIVIPQNSTAKQIANVLNNVAGVNANARNAIELSNLKITHNEPLQITLNGESLLEYSLVPPSAPVLSAVVPDPASNPIAFNDYVAQRINENQNLGNAGVYAVSAVDAVTGRSKLQVFSTQGGDFRLELEAASGETIDVSDASGNPNVALIGAGNSSNSTLIIGGRLDVTLSENIALTTLLPTSLLFGDSTAANFAQSSYLGIQTGISGVPTTSDTFTIDFNQNAALDNRNALALVDLQQKKTIDGVASFSEGYGKLVEQVGIKTNQVQINTDAAEKVLEQSTELRNSISAVNLDEEAANLIRFEQTFSANAQAIAIARDLFDRLINSF